MASSSWQYRQDIDGLRALAVAIVILFHFEFSSVPGGFVGVDVFFVISGFLITSLIARQIADDRFSLVDFYERRFRRIYPNLLIVLAMTAILGFIAMVPLTYRPFGRSLIWATLSASNFAFIGGNGYFDPDNLTKPLLHTWSLGVEEQFYLVFPWLLILAVRRGYSARWLIGTVVALSLALSIGAALADWDASYFLLPTRFWQLGVGALIALLPQGDRLSYAKRSVLGLAGFAAIGWTALRLTEAAPFPGYLALPPTLGAAAIIWANGGVVGRLLSLTPFVWIGRLSFALYLWHWPLISIAAGIGLAPTEPYVRLAITVIMLALSVAGYHLWEQPIRQRRMLAERRRFFLVLSIFAITLVGAGTTIFQMKGVPQRLPDDLVALETAAEKDSYLIASRCRPVENEIRAVCSLGHEDSRDVSFVIIGDSHSIAVAAEIGDLAKAYNLHGLLFGRASCPVLVGLTRAQDPKCIERTEFVLNEIQKLNPRLVIFIAQWSELLGEPTGEHKTPIFLDENPVLEQDRLRVVSNALDETLKRIGSRSIVIPITFPEYQGKASVIWRLWTERLGLPSSLNDLPTSELLTRQTYLRKMLVDAKARHGNLSLIDPTPVFCPSEVCIRATKDAILYRDNTHLSHAGAKLYAPLFQPYLSALAATQEHPSQ